jgi:hypothetical protein
MHTCNPMGRGYNPMGRGYNPMGRGAAGELLDLRAH